MRKAAQARRSRAKLVEENAGCDSDVQRFDARVERQRHELGAGTAHVSAKSRALVPDRERETAWRAAPSYRNAVDIGAPQRDSRFIEEQLQLVPCTMESGVQKVSAHCATDDFGVPQVNGARKGYRGGGAEAGCGANQGSDVAGILYGVQHEYARWVGCSERFE